MSTVLDVDLWASTHSECAADSAGFSSAREADFIYRSHAGHGPSCRQFLAAMAYDLAEAHGAEDGD